MRSIIVDYEKAKLRCASFHHWKPSGNYRKDVQRILFSQDKENDISADELYRQFDWINYATLRSALEALRESDWQFTPPEDRVLMLYTIFGNRIPYNREVFCDFRCGGYRLLGDVLMDLYDQYESKAVHKHKGVRQDDTAQMRKMMRGATDSQDYRQTLIQNCRSIISPRWRGASEKPLEQIAWDDAVKCAEALGKRSFILEVMPLATLDLVIDCSTGEEDEPC